MDCKCRRNDCFFHHRVERDGSITVTHAHPRKEEGKQITYNIRRGFHPGYTSEGFQIVEKNVTLDYAIKWCDATLNLLSAATYYIIEDEQGNHIHTVKKITIEKTVKETKIVVL